MSGMPWARYAAWALTFLWAAWWTFFVIASEASHAGGLRHYWVPALLGTLLFIGTAFAAWRWEGAGAAVLLAIGLVLLWFVLVICHNAPATTLFLVLTMVIPPLVAGFLLLGDWWRTRSLGPA